jgi:hypothetical protein
LGDSYILWTVFLKITEITNNFSATFFHEYVYALILTKKGFGYIWGDFFH